MPRELIPSGSAFPSLDLSLIILDASDVAHIGVAHFFELGDSSPGAGAALAVNKDGSRFIAQEICGVVDLCDGNIAAAADVAAAVFLLCADIQKDCSFCRPAPVDFFVDVYSFKKIQK